MSAKQTSYFKIGLVIVLAIVFVGALANSVLTIRRASPPVPPPARHAAKPQPLPAAPVSSPPQAAAAPRTVAAPPATPAIKEIQQSPTTETSKPAWPEFTLDEIIAYDPFAIAKSGDPAAPSRSTASGDTKAAIPGATDDPKAAESGSALPSRIHAVYQRGGKTAALVGSKTIRPGDDLEGAGRVVEVDQGGLMLEVKK
jgi:hypothetical protein